MFCTNCGSQVKDGAAFCTNCGAKMNVQPVQAAPVVPAPSDNIFGETQVLTQENAAFIAAAQPAYEAPVQSAYEAPVQPAYEAPAQPVYEAPVQPAYEAPVQPAYEAPAQPVYEQPTQPSVYQQPVQPVYQQPVYQQPVNYGVVENDVPHNGYVGFGQAVALFFKNYVNFKGRAGRSEYWFAVLFTSLVSLAAYIPYIGWMVCLAVLLPELSLAIRRLHDIGKSWPYIFMGFIPFAGIIIMFIKMLQPSEGDNKWGRGPVD